MSRFGDMFERWEEMTGAGSNRKKGNCAGARESDPEGNGAGRRGADRTDNFGDILERWDRMQGGEGSGKKRDAAPADSRAQQREQKAADARRRSLREDIPDAKKTHSVLEEWLLSHGVQDKDSEASSSPSPRPWYALPIDAQIDLHGYTRDEAWERLEVFVGYCVRRQYKKILIIHGKGRHSQEGSVLKEMVRTFIDCHERLGRSGRAGERSGGSGATWVLIKAPPVHNNSH